MKGFIEVFNTKNNTVELINTRFIQAVVGNKIAIFDGSNVEWCVYAKETYEEIKELIKKAMD